MLTDRISKVIIRPTAVFRLLSLLSFALFVIYLVAIYTKLVQQMNTFVVNMIYFFFDMSKELTVPSLYSTLILFIAAMLLLFISATIGKNTNTRIYWMILSAIFFFLTVDEAIAIHEQFDRYGSAIKKTSGYLHYVWIIPYAIFTLVVGIFFVRFLFGLPVKTRVLFIIAGIIYAGSAIGFELLEGNIVATYGKSNVQDKLFCALEEFLEMFGISIFIYALLDYISGFNVAAQVSGDTKIISEVKNPEMILK